MINSFSGDNEFLSNFFRVWVKLDGVLYPSVEHAYQASKTLVHNERKLVLACSTPGKAKRQGRKITLRPDFQDVKFSLMYDFIDQKFNVAPLGWALMATDPEDLVEGNMWHDNYWGDCHCPKCKDKEGKNKLGEMLMTKRRHLILENEGILCK